MKNGVQRTWVQSPKMRKPGDGLLSRNFNFTSEDGRGEGSTAGALELDE